MKKRKGKKQYALLNEQFNGRFYTNGRYDFHIIINIISVLPVIPFSRTLPSSIGFFFFFFNIVHYLAEIQREPLEMDNRKTWDFIFNFLRPTLTLGAKDGF